MRKLALTAISLATAGWLAVSGAVAAPITGDFSIDGTDSFSFTTHTISILTNTIAVGHGDFAGLAGSSVTFTPANPIDYTALTGQLFTGNSGLSFTISGLASFTETPGVPPTLDSLAINANGVLTLMGFDPTPGVFSLTTQGTQGVEVTFSATTVAVPGPVVGAGIPALLASCGGLLALARRRRQQVA